VEVRPEDSCGEADSRLALSTRVIRSHADYVLSEFVGLVDEPDRSPPSFQAVAARASWRERRWALHSPTFCL
jgi:hypothetical protein